MNEIDIFLEELRQRAKSKSFEEYTRRLKFAYRVDGQCDELIKEGFTKTKFLETKSEPGRVEEGIENLEGDFVLTNGDVQLRVFLILSQNTGKLDMRDVKRFLNCFALFPQTAGIVCVWDTESLDSGFGNFYHFQGLLLRGSEDGLRLSPILPFKDAVKKCYEKQVKSWKIPKSEELCLKEIQIPHLDKLLKEYIKDEMEQLLPDSFEIPEKKEAYSKFSAKVNFELMVEVANKISSGRLNQEQIEKLIEELLIDFEND